MLFYKTSMALSLSFPPNLFTSSSSFLISQTRAQSSSSFRTSCSYQKIEAEREIPKRNQVAYKVPKKKRKLRPSFYEQVRQRWSLKNPSQRLKLPWEEKEEEQQDEDEEEEGEEEEEKDEKQQQQQSSSLTLNSLEDKGKAALIDDPVKFGIRNRLAAPWVQKSKLRNTHFDSETTSEEDEEVGEKLNDLNKGEATWVQTSKPRKTHFISETKSAHSSGFDEDEEVREKLEKNHFISETKSAHNSGFDEDEEVREKLEKNHFISETKSAHNSGFDEDEEVREKLEKTHFISETKSAHNSGFDEDEEVREKLEKPHFISETKIAQNSGFDGDKEKKLKESNKVVNSRDGNSEEKKRNDGFLVSVDKNGASSSIGSVEKNLMQLGQDFNGVSLNEKQSGLVKDVVKVADLGEESSSIRLPWENINVVKQSRENINVVKQSREKKDVVRSVGLSDYHDSVRLPWEKANERDLEYLRKDKWTKNNTEMAEKLIPERELKRLRNVSLRMKERIKVGAAGVTQPLVDCIHEKWKLDEVVKFKFEGPPALNMKRMHETLERRTGGLVIWRSGSSLVLFRGMSYKLPCVQSYAKETDVARDVAVSDSDRTEVSSFNYSVKTPKDPSAEEIMELSELNDLLDELGPRFRDWTGVDPQPVDADLLPGVIPNYVRPFRLLPHGMRLAVRNKEMTSFRRLARKMRPHFALGRSRELQGLAKAMVKLWERSSIAKIAIKRGVLNTNNERMAEELQKLTGGTLVSRNKEYIVFYRGKDFLPPEVTHALVERQKLAEIRQDEEEEARQRASTFIVQNSKTLQGPLVAGTLAETLAADTRWACQPSSKDMEKMKRDLELAKHASLVRYLERKLSIAQAKVRKAERALAKVQQYLKPTDLPTDLETITDEERFLFRKMGLTMRPFLHVGKRGVFDGTVENMHLHWKYRELVKLIVRGKSFPQVKHIAINLEAESGGLLISLDKTTKGHVIIVYRGKNYQRPNTFRPKNLLTKRQALARSIELQRREALNHHIANLTENIEMMKSELNRMEAAKEKGDYYSKLNDAYYHNDEVEDEGEEAYLETYDMGDENQDPHDEEAGLTSSENQDPHDLK